MKRTRGAGSAAKRARESGNPAPIFLVTGSTGRTAAQVLQAALAQFKNPAVSISTEPRVRSARKATQVAEQAAAVGGVILHTVVDPKIRSALMQAAERRGVPLVDILGPVLRLLEDHLGTTARNQPGLSYELHKEQFDRIDSVDFTLAHDDGARLQTLHQADVVLVGVSRVAKSVTCSYLALRGIRAANVPLTLDCEPPPELIRLDPQRVIGLTMNASRLQAIRAARIRAMRYGAVDYYTEQEEVVQELRYAAELMRKHGWRSIDVSYMSVEEIASRILELIQEPSSPPAAGSGDGRRPKSKKRRG